MEQSATVHEISKDSDFEIIDEPQDKESEPPPNTNESSREESEDETESPSTPEMPEELLEDEYFSKLHKFFADQKNVIQTLTQRLLDAQADLDSFPDQMRLARKIVREQEEQNKNLMLRVSALEQELRQYRAPLPSDETWTEEDERRNSIRPSWKYLKPMRNALNNVEIFFRDSPTP